MRAVNVFTHKQTWGKQGLWCPRCPPEGPTVGSHFASPDRDRERKHSDVSRNSSYISGGDRPPPPQSSRGNLGSLRVGPIPRLHSRYCQRGLWFRALHQLLRGALHSIQPVDELSCLLTSLTCQVRFAENTCSSLAGLKVGFPQGHTKSRYGSVVKSVSRL